MSKNLWYTIISKHSYLLFIDKFILVLTIILICTNQITAKDLSAFVEKNLLTFEYCFIPESRYFFNNHLNKLSAVITRFENELLKARIKVFLDDIGHLSNNSCSFRHQTELSFSIEYLFIEELLTHFN